MESGSNKAAIVIIIFGILIGVAGVYFLFWGNDDEETLSEPTQFPSGGGGQFPGRSGEMGDGADLNIGTLTVSASVGEDITVRNITIEPHTTDLGSNNYLVSEVQGQNASYDILYHAGDQSFLIALGRSPLGTVRRAAELELLSLLGISQEDACRLKIRVATSVHVSGEFGARELGLSFCPGATPLE